ncbi:hypothetical protein [Sporosarcina sp. FSL K6-3457]|uniref:hypothetical protein n=1 Tax=Sporosarcina sp. FSL K6-3457 TaxID=2978204 RepID=UPI0030F88B54
MYCIQCGYHQSEGKFCAKCGTALGNDLNGIVEAIVVTSRRRQSNDYVGQMIALFKRYGHYCLKYLKRPSEVFKEGEKEFTNGTVTIGLLAVLVGLTIFTFMQDVESTTLSVIASVIAYVLMSTVMVLGSLYVTTMFLGPEQSVKKLIGIYGTYLIPVACIVFIAFIFQLINVNTLGNLLLLFALLFVLSIIPLYIVIKLLTQDVSVLDPLYSVVVYMVVFSILSYICLAIFGDFIMGDMLNWLRFRYI